MKENQHVQPVVNVEAGTVTFNVKGYQPLILEMAKLHPDIIKRAALAGMAQVRVVDRAAVGMTDDEGNILSEADRIALKHSRMAELIEHYHTGTADWNIAGQGGGARSITIEAIARVKGVSYEEAEEYVDTFAAKEHKLPDGTKVSFKDRKEALKYLRDGKRVLEAIQAIREERQPKPKADADAMLDQLSKS